MNCNAFIIKGLDSAVKNIGYSSEDQGFQSLFQLQVLQQPLLITQGTRYPSGAHTHTQAKYEREKNFITNDISGRKYT